MSVAAIPVATASSATDVKMTNVPVYGKSTKTEWKNCLEITPGDAACVNNIRALAAAVVGKAKSGHPGAPMGCAPMAHALFGHVMKYDAKNPKWEGRDRFVLSNGHASALQYTMLHIAGYESMTMDQLKSFRQWSSITPGHPESHMTPGVEVTTGPLGQGVAQAVGMAFASANMRANFGEEVCNSTIYTIVGDGCLQEGIAAEACSLAGHLGLSDLVVMYDRNGITIDGCTDLSFTDDTAAKFRSWNWNVLFVADGDSDLPAIVEALEKAKAEKQRPTLIVVDTTIGYGSAKQGTADVHGAPLSEDDLNNVRKMCGLEADPFMVNENVKAFYSAKMGANDAIVAQYEDAKKSFLASGSPKAEAYRKFMAASGHGIDFKTHASKLVEELINISKEKLVEDAPRNTSQMILRNVASMLPTLTGGSADLKGSNKTDAVAQMNGPYQKDTPQGRYLYFGVREHAMCAISNGIAAFGGYHTFNSTFLNFYTYAWGAVRLSALSNLPTLMLATHDSIELGEDGPTHQPIEVAALCRATPNLHFIRPGNAREVLGSYCAWLSSEKTPVMVALARGKVPNHENSCAHKTMMGAYILEDFKGTGRKLIVAGSGTELQVAVGAAPLLREQGFDVRVVSMPCWSLFELQDKSYRDSVLPSDVPAAYCEAYSSLGVERYFKRELCMTLDHFGASAPANKIREELGFTPAKFAAKITANISN